MNSIDLLIFAWVSYAIFSSVADSLPLTLEEIAKKEEFQTLVPYSDSFLPKKSKMLFLALAASPRFHKVKLIDAMEKVDKEEIVQFAAIALELPNCVVVSFKGTSPGYIGWKEDFVLSYQMGIASYRKAEEFLDRVAKKTDKPLKVIGHSKGGHVAAYCLCRSKHRDHIDACYSFDGPGFRDQEIIKMLKEDPRYTKIIPSFSLVGILLSNDEEVKIVRSVNVGALQHDPFSWQVKEGDFIYVRQRSLSSKRLDTALNGWIYSLTEEQRKRFTEVLFGALEKFRAQDFAVFFKNLPAQIPPLRKAYKELDKPDKELVDEVMKRLFKHLMQPGKPTS